VGQQGGLDLGRVDVLAAGDDQVVAPVDDVEVALRVEAAEVAGPQPGALLAGRLVDVTGADRRPAGQDLADLARAGVDAQLGREERLAGRAEPGQIGRASCRERV